MKPVLCIRRLKSVRKPGDDGSRISEWPSPASGTSGHSSRPLRHLTFCLKSWGWINVLAKRSRWSGWLNRVQPLDSSEKFCEASASSAFGSTGLKRPVPQSNRSFPVRKLAGFGRIHTFASCPALQRGNRSLQPMLRLPGIQAAWKCRNATTKC